MPAFTASVKTISGQHIAKAVYYRKQERAYDAAAWLLGLSVVKPTLKHAAETFHVSVPLVAQARRRLIEARKSPTSGNGNGIISPEMSDAVIDNMISEIGVDRFWAALDRATQPQLPLQAAE